MFVALDPEWVEQGLLKRRMQFARYRTEAMHPSQIRHPGPIICGRELERASIAISAPL
jgi:hypothetical protein